jgi:large subunit ribosomal protein L30e
MDIKKSLRLAVDSGKVEFGVNQAKKLIANGEAKLVVLSIDCPAATKNEITRDAKLAKIPVQISDEKAVLLGSTCGKPYPTSVLSVLDVGTSDILEVIKK